MNVHRTELFLFHVRKFCKILEPRVPKQESQQTYCLPFVNQNPHYKKAPKEDFSVPGHRKGIKMEGILV